MKVLNEVLYLYITPGEIFIALYFLINHQLLFCTYAGKAFTIEKVLTTLEVIFTHEGTLSQHGVRLASQLTKLFTHHSEQAVSSSRERDGSSSGERDDSSLALERLILSHWNLTQIKESCSYNY